MEELIKNINKIHTTEMGVTRIKKNLNINSDVVEYVKNIILNEFSTITKIGKNYYITYKNIIITVNIHSYTIITAHTIKN